jgi:hypothetical protein
MVDWDKFNEKLSGHLEEMHLYSQNINIEFPAELDTVIASL